MKNISTIIVTYNGMFWIKKCLDSLRKSSISTTVYVIDNCSTDGTPEFIEKNYGDIILVRSKENLGFGKGNNLGIQLALDKKSDGFFLLNQDAWVEEATLETLIAVHKLNDNYGILSPIHLYSDNKSLETKFEEYAGPQNTNGLLSDLFLNQIKPIYETNFVNAASWLISRECLLKVGGFNPLYPHYGEDEDYVHRVKYWGFKIGIVPMAKITHDSVFSWEKIEFNPKRNLIFNYINLSNINQRSRSAWLLFIKKSIDELSSLLLFRKFARFKVRFKAFFTTIKNVRRIKKFRKMSLKEGAFLDI